MSRKRKKASKPKNHQRPKCSISAILTILSTIVRIIKDISDMIK
ncbi:hypothetical protein AB2T85_20640 [Clostridium butyricum]